MLWPTYCVGVHHDDGSTSSNRLESGGYTGGTEGSLPGQSMTLSFVHDSMDCGWSGRDGSSVRRRQLWECTTGRYRRGWAGIEREVWRECCATRWQAGATAVSEPRSGAGVDRGGVERAIQDSGRDQPDWIESEYGVSYKSGSVYGLLERLGCSLEGSEGPS